jgi:hypothetical protein
MSTYNLTPHDIVVYYGTAGGARNIPASGHVARLAMTSEPAGIVDGLPCVCTVFGALSGVPAGVEYMDVLIVSSLAADAVAREYPGVTVLVPDTGPTAMRNESGQIAGVTQFRKVEDALAPDRIEDAERKWNLE